MTISSIVVWNRLIKNGIHLCHMLGCAAAQTKWPFILLGALNMSCKMTMRGFNAENSESIQVKDRRTQILNNWTRKEGAAGKGRGEQRKTPFSRVECFARCLCGLSGPMKAGNILVGYLPAQVTATHREPTGSTTWRSHECIEIHTEPSPLSNVALGGGGCSEAAASALPACFEQNSVTAQQPSLTIFKIIAPHPASMG